jgi:hypothetical protein
MEGSVHGIIYGTALKLPRGTEENHKTPQSEDSLCAEIWPRNSWIQSKKTNHLAGTVSDCYIIPKLKIKIHIT